MLPGTNAGSKNGKPWMWSQWTWLKKMCAVNGISFSSVLPSRRRPVPPSKTRSALARAHLDAARVAADLDGVGARRRDAAADTPKGDAHSNVCDRPPARGAVNEEASRRRPRVPRRFGELEWRLRGLPAGGRVRPAEIARTRASELVLASGGRAWGVPRALEADAFAEELERNGVSARRRSFANEHHETRAKMRVSPPGCSRTGASEASPS